MSASVVCVVLCCLNNTHTLAMLNVHVHACVLSVKPTLSFRCYRANTCVCVCAGMHMFV